MNCFMCEGREKYWNGGDPKCAFGTSVFSGENWMCATVNAVREICESDHPLVLKRRYDDQSCAFINIAHIELETSCANGLYVNWYKNRGCTEEMWLLGDGDPVKPSETDCLSIIEWFKNSDTVN